MKLKQKLDDLLPSYTRIPLVVMVCVHALAYYATRPVSQKLVHFDFSLPIDDAIPFIPAFSVIYVLAYVQWIVGYILIARDSRELCYRVISGEIISKLICMALFLLIPTTMERAEIVSAGFSTGSLEAFTGWTRRTIFSRPYTVLKAGCVFEARCG